MPNHDQPAGRRPSKLAAVLRSEEHTSELQSHSDLVCRLLLEKKKYRIHRQPTELAAQPLQLSVRANSRDRLATDRVRRLETLPATHHQCSQPPPTDNHESRHH